MDTPEPHRGKTGWVAATLNLQDLLCFVCFTLLRFSLAGFSATKRTSEFQIIDTVQDWQHSPLIHTQGGNDIQVGRPSESSWVPPSKRISNTPLHRPATKYMSMSNLHDVFERICWLYGPAVSSVGTPCWAWWFLYLNLGSSSDGLQFWTCKRRTLWKPKRHWTAFIWCMSWIFVCQLFQDLWRHRHSLEFS